MSNCIATITDIRNVQRLHVVSFSLEKRTFKMMSLDLSSEITVGKKVLLQCKPTAVAIAKNISGDLSYSNQIPATIETIQEGELLSSLTLSFGTIRFESIITTDSKRRMDLQIGASVTALIKASDLSIEKVL